MGPGLVFGPNTPRSTWLTLNNSWSDRASIRHQSSANSRCTVHHGLLIGVAVFRSLCPRFCYPHVRNEYTSPSVMYIAYTDRSLFSIHTFLRRLSRNLIILDFKDPAEIAFNVVVIILLKLKASRNKIIPNGNYILSTANVKYRMHAIRKANIVIKKIYASVKGYDKLEKYVCNVCVKKNCTSLMK